MHEIYSKCQNLFVKINGVSPYYPLISMRANMHKLTFLCLIASYSTFKNTTVFFGGGWDADLMLCSVQCFYEKCSVISIGLSF